MTDSEVVQETHQREAVELGQWLKSWVLSKSQFLSPQYEAETMENVYVCDHSISALCTMSSIELKPYEDSLLQPLVLWDYLLWEYFLK